MTWTTKIIKKEFVLGKDKLQVEVEYTNGTQKLSIVYYIRNIIELKSLVRERIKKLEDLEVNFQTLVKGDLDSSEKLIILTQKEINRENYEKDIQKYYQIEKAIEMNILNSSAIDDIKLKLKNDYSSDYIDLL